MDDDDDETPDYYQRFSDAVELYVGLDIAADVDDDLAAGSDVG